MLEDTPDTFNNECLAVMILRLSCEGEDSMRLIEVQKFECDAMAAVMVTYCMKSRREYLVCVRGTFSD